ncbi:TPA: beta-lactamase family protein, partial [Legionella pneumophila]|nr:beta-lactamase family protein [Legionella pneumophila]
MSYAKMAELLLLDVMSKAQIPGVSIAFISSDGIISTQEQGLTEGCGLFAIPVDPLKCLFNKLGLGTKDAVVLFDDKLYYVNQTTQSIHQIQLNESNQSSYQKLRESCTDTYKLADPQESELITTLTGLAPPTRVKPETVFGAASLSKPVFAYLVQKLIQSNATNQAEKGTGKFNLDKFNLSQFDLDTPLFHILPLEEFEIDGMKFDMSDTSAVVCAQALTARMVLSHTTGLAHGEMKFQFIPNPKEKDSKEKMHGYSNVGIVYLQQVIEKLTEANLETLAKNHVFDHCDMTHSTYEPPKAYHLLLHAEKEPLFDEMKPGQIVILKEDEQLTAYWLENGKIVNRSFPERVVPGILRQLPDKGKLSNNLELIEAVISQYGCKEPKPCAANTLRTTATDYAKFVKHLSHDNSIENPFVPHAFMTHDRGLAGAIGIARDKIPELILSHVAWGLGWGLQTNEKEEVVTAYHSGDMNDCRAWVAVNLK